MFKQALYHIQLYYSITSLGYSLLYWHSHPIQTKVTAIIHIYLSSIENLEFFLMFLPEYPNE